jgi:hypothetical protein
VDIADLINFAMTLIPDYAVASKRSLELGISMLNPTKRRCHGVGEMAPSLFAVPDATSFLAVPASHPSITNVPSLLCEFIAGTFNTHLSGGGGGYNPFAIARVAALLWFHRQYLHHYALPTLAVAPKKRARSKGPMGPVLYRRAIGGVIAELTQILGQQQQQQQKLE